MSGQRAGDNQGQPAGGCCPWCGATGGVTSKATASAAEVCSCAACGASWDASISPQVLTGELLAALRAMTATVTLPVAQMVRLDPVASVDTVAWWCRLCCDGSSARTWARAHDAAAGHLAAEHRGVVQDRCDDARGEGQVAGLRHQRATAGLAGRGERGRVQAPGRHVDTDASHVLLLVHESDRAWTVYAAAAGVRLEADVMVTVCEAVLSRARLGQEGSQ